jgi:hypothetical protein
MILKYHSPNIVNINASKIHKHMNYLRLIIFSLSSQPTSTDG